MEEKEICLPVNPPADPPKLESDPPAEDPDAPVSVQVGEDEVAPAQTDAATEEPVDDTQQQEKSEASPSEQEPSPESRSEDPDAPADSELSSGEIEPEQLLIESIQPEATTDSASRLALLEAIVYVTDEPLTLEQIAKAMGKPSAEIRPLLDQLVEEYNRPEHGLTVKEIAGGYKMATKPEHHEAVRTFVKNLNPPLKLSLAALETLAVIAYKQPITAPEIMEIRGVQGAGVLKTLIDRKLITTAGRKNVVGKPILYKTTKEFLLQFGLRDLNELPTLKEFEELRRMAFADTEPEDAGKASEATP